MEDGGYNLILGIEIAGLILLLFIIYRQGVQNKEITGTIDRNTQLFERSMNTQEKSDEIQKKMTANLDRTERYIIESTTKINLRLENIERKK